MSPRFKPRLPSLPGLPTLPKPSKTVVSGVAGTAAVLAVGAVSVLQFGLLDVDTIAVSGNTQVSTEAIKDTAGVHPGRAIFSVDETRAEHRLRANPWISSAKVSTDWPHGVRIAVTERRAIAQAQTVNGKWAQIGEGGVVLGVGDAPTPELGALLDVQAPATPGQLLDSSATDLVELATLLPQSLRSQVVQLQVDPKSGLRLGLRSGVIVELGDKRDLPDKLTSAAAVVSNGDAKTMAVLDVRSPHLPVVTPKA